MIPRGRANKPWHIIHESQTKEKQSNQLHLPQYGDHNVKHCQRTLTLSTNLTKVRKCLCKCNENMIHIPAPLKIEEEEKKKTKNPATSIIYYYFIFHCIHLLNYSNSYIIEQILVDHMLWCPRSVIVFIMRLWMAFQPDPDSRSFCVKSIDFRILLVIYPINKCFITVLIEYGHL